MNDKIVRPHTQDQSSGVWLALGLNMIWVNLSEVWRYFAIIKPMLHDTFPGDVSIAAVTPGIFASWMLWDTVLIVAATGFYWLYLTQMGQTLKQVLLAATYFTLTIFGLIWLGVVNMGLVPLRFLFAALPLAWVEQVVAAWLVYWVMGRSRALA